MNQTKKRLAIIKLAISMTDTETIQLQILKLDLLKTDDRMKEIITMLNEHNYVQAQRLISSYIEVPNDTIIQRASKVEESTEIKSSKSLTLQEKIQRAKKKVVADEFHSLANSPKGVIKTTEAIENKINYDPLVDIAPEPEEPSTDNVNYDALLDIKADDILAENITLDISKKEKNILAEKEITIKTSSLPNDDFLDMIQPSIDEPEASTLKEIWHSQKNKSQKKHKTKTSSIEKETSTPKAQETDYGAIPYIEQKLKNMNSQYPPVHTSSDTISSDDEWLLKIANEGYSESEVEKMIRKAEQLSQTNKAKAAQLFLLTTATQSKYANLRLARELYKGELLKKNLKEAFAIINRLAINDDYPEAVCDLGQFYENGITTKKDKKKAKELYEEAMNLGIQRAGNHYRRLLKEEKGIFSVFKK